MIQINFKTYLFILNEVLYSVLNINVVILVPCSEFDFKHDF